MPTLELFGSLHQWELLPTWGLFSPDNIRVAVEYCSGAGSAAPRSTKSCVGVRALEFPRWEFPALKYVEFQLEFPARKGPFRGNSLEFPHRGGHCNYRGGLLGDVILKIIGISCVSCNAMQSPCVLALPVPDVDMQLANSKPAMDEGACKEHYQSIRFGGPRALLFYGSLK